MSFTDPLAITIATFTTSLPLTERDGDDTKYTSGDGYITFSAGHDYGKRIRRTLRVDTKRISPDVFRDDVNVEQSMSVYVVYDIPKVGYKPNEVKDVSDGFLAMLSANSGLLVTKLLAGES